MADEFEFRSWEPTYYTYSKDELMRYIRQLEAEVRRLEGSEMELGMADGCLNEIREVLQSIGCVHGPGSHAGTPPMMYGEWIVCVVYSAAREAHDKVNAIRGVLATRKSEADKCAEIGEIMKGEQEGGE